MKLFTYGTLKDPNKLKQDGATNIIENARVEGYQMYLYSDAFPVTKKTGKPTDVIYGTLCEMPDDVVLKHYDYIEGYRPNRPKRKNLYNREEVPVLAEGCAIRAQMYIANEDCFKSVYVPQNLIESGNFDDIKRLSFEEESLLDELYKLTIVAQYRELSKDEENRYVEIVEYCHQNNIPIDFGIEI